MKNKGDKIIIPFLGTDKISINKSKEFAKREYSDAKKYIYKKPEFIKFKGKLEPKSFWTYPNIEVIY